MAMTRRDFIRVIGGGVLAVTSGCLNTGSREAAPLPRGIEEWTPSVCGQCTGGCGIIARVVGGRVVKLEGNPGHPVNRGTLCARGQAGLQVIYDPDRIRTPLKRTGERGSGRWREIGWDEAIVEVAARIEGLRRKGEGRRIALLSGPDRGSQPLLSKSFMDALGSPHYFRMPDDNDDMPLDAIQAMHGAGARPLYDIAGAGSILSFGSTLLESFSSPVQVLRAYGEFRGGKGRRRGQLVHISPRRSVTGIKADGWIPVRPGTEGAFAMGIAHVIIRESLYDREFAGKAQGFDSFRELVLREYSPRAVSAVTSVAERQIEETAREFSLNGPSVAVTTRRGLRDQMAVHALNGLTGSIGKKGGVLFRADHEKAAPLLPGSLLPKGTEALLIHGCNPLFTLPGMAGAVKDLSFIVSFSPFMDETARMADLILPDHTSLEAWGDTMTFTLQGGSVVSIEQPVSKPLYNTMQTGDVMIKIAGVVGEAMPWRDYREFLDSSVRRRGGAGQGIEEVLKAGGWLELRTPEEGGGEKFDFSPLVSELASFRFGSPEDAGAYPLYLSVYRLSTHSGIRDYNQPFLKESLTPEIPEAWDSWVEINPQTASGLGLSQGDTVWVESARGRIRLRMRLYAGVRPDVVAIPWGLGEGGEGRWNKGVGVNPDRIAETGDQLTRVRVYKA